MGWNEWIVIAGLLLSVCGAVCIILSEEGLPFGGFLILLGVVIALSGFMRMNEEQAQNAAIIVTHIVW